MNSPDKPVFKKGNPSTMEGGSGAYNYVQDLIKEGISPQAKDVYERQGTMAINNAYNSGTQKLNETVARNRGATPLGFQASGQAALAGQKAMGITDLKDKLAMAIQQGKASGVDLYTKLYQQALAQSEGENQFNIGMYAYDSQNAFRWDDLFNTVLGGAAQVGSAYVGKGTGTAKKQRD